MWSSRNEKKRSWKLDVNKLSEEQINQSWKIG